MFEKTKTMTPEIKARKQAAEAAAETVRSSEAALLGALSNLQAARNRVGTLERESAALRQKIADLLRAGDVAAAEKAGRQLVDAQAAGEVAALNVDLHRKNIEACEGDLVRAEQGAELAHRQCHSAIHAELLSELHADALSKWLRAWQHGLASGDQMTFQDYARNVLLNSGAMATPTAPMDFPAAPPVAASIGFSERREMRDRVFARQNAG